MTRTPLLAALAASLALGGCATKGLSADDATKIIGAFHNAGCGGNVAVHLGASTGQLGGQASGSLDASGDCPKAAPLTIDQLLAAAAPATPPVPAPAP